MPLSTKHKFRSPINTDHTRLWEHLQNLANDVDKKVAHRSLPYLGRNYVESGAAMTNPSGLNIAFSAGVAMIGGQTFEFAASGNIAATASVTNHFWLTATLDANGFITGYTFVKRTDTVVPANSVYLGTGTAGASSFPSGYHSTFRGVIGPGNVIAHSTAGAAGGTGVKNSLIYVSDGQTPIAVDVGMYAYTGSASSDLMNFNFLDSQQGYAINYNGPFPANFAGVALPYRILGLARYTPALGVHTLTNSLNNANTAGANVAASSSFLRAIFD